MMDKRKSRTGSVFLLTAALLALVPTAGDAASIAAEPKDTREGDNVTLTCRFPPEVSAQNPTLYWLRTNKREPDNVAVNSNVFDANYKLEYLPLEGRYDLLISNVSYERDNGQFECRVKAPNTNVDLHAQAVLLTVLMQPEPPKVVQGPRPTATEGKPFTLMCSSAGGSPDPQILWYRSGVSQPLDAIVRPGTDREPTTATLSLNATRSDDGAIFRCQVWNRALPGNTKLETIVTLSVNYYPRVDIGPDNPIRVERDGSAKLQCNVDAKPKVNNVRWTRNGVFISNQMTHTIQRVTVHDAGVYICSAENGLGQIGEAELKLDVLYPPQVSVETGPGSSKQREVEEGESVTVQCNVSANPAPTSVEWVREGHPEFRQMGKILNLQRVTAESAGTYTCRAVNFIEPTTAPRRRVEHIGNASMTLLVRHRPGQARISPDKPIATEGSGVTLSCSASPPGWPAPQYRWWREIDDPHGNVPASGSTPISVLTTGPKYTITSAHMGIEGTYHCQANNEMGHGEPASVSLQVYQAPRFSEKLPPHLTKKVGDKDFFARCAAQCKPKPSIRWLKDKREIGPGSNNGLDSHLFDVSTEESEARNGIFTIQSILRFTGADRANTSQLQPFDSGTYSCVFENEVKRVESSMLLSIEHKPILLNRYDKVAYDLQEDALIVCRVQAYPKPEFQWSYGTNPAVLLTSSTGHYEINATIEGDVYTSILKVSQIRDNDYGEYICRANNGQGALKAVFHLQPKGPPEHPRSLKTTIVGHNFVTLQWEPGFDGGLQNTKYFVAYRRVAGGLSNGVAEDQSLASDCYSAGDISDINTDLEADTGSWQEFDCQRNNPCNVTSLEQHASYVFKVKALNTKGNSNHSEIVAARTKVDRIPSPQRVAFDPESHVLSINVAATCLQLVAQVEVTYDLPNEKRNEDWRSVEMLTMATSGANPTRRDATLKSLAERSMEYPQHSSARSLGIDKDDIYRRQPSDDNELRDYGPNTAEPRVRVRLCLRPSPDTCGEYAEAEIGPSYIKEASVLATPTLIAIVVSCIVFVLFLGLLFTFCRCKRHNNKKANSKNYEMNSPNVRPSIMTQQPPPPYFHENKALEHSLDLAIDDATKGHHLYTTQNGYGYHGGTLPTHHQHLGAGQGHPINGGEWVNMGYMENSYSNSNNGGSVNSQDSLWQMKMAAAASNNGSHTGVADNQSQYLHNHGNPLGHGGMERSNSAYGYDPLAHGGYGAVDDYGTYPHLAGQDMEYGRHLSQGRNSANPSRQDYSSSVDPYAAVQKSRRRGDAPLDSPYHDVSGLPDPYNEQLDLDEKPPHHGLSYDESLESGYSTPNSRNRRVIREIIV